MFNSIPTYPKERHERGGILSLISSEDDSTCIDGSDPGLVLTGSLMAGARVGVDIHTAPTRETRAPIFCVAQNIYLLLRTGQVS